MASADLADFLNERPGNLTLGCAGHSIRDPDDEARARADGGPYSPDHQQGKAHQEDDVHNDRLNAS